MRKCIECSEEKELSAFRKKGLYPDGRQRYYAQCSPCVRERMRYRYAANPAPAIAAARATKLSRTEKMRALKAHPCSDCGGSFPPMCMDFDHVRGEKLFNVGQANSVGWDRVLAEVEKCELVCANCHRIRTYNRLMA